MKLTQIVSGYIDQVEACKLAISSSIENKGQSLENVPFSGYAAKIDDIQTGGGGPFDIIKITEYTPAQYTPVSFSATFTGTSSQEFDFNQYSGIYTVTPETSSLQGSNRIYKHNSKNYWIKSVESDWEEDLYWALVQNITYSSIWNAALYDVNKKGLIPITTIWRNNDTWDGATTTFSNFNYNIKPMVLSGYKATSYNNGNWVLSNQQSLLSGYEIQPLTGAFYSVKGTETIGNFIDTIHGGSQIYLFTPFETNYQPYINPSFPEDANRAWSVSQNSSFEMVDGKQAIRLPYDNWARYSNICIGYTFTYGISFHCDSALTGSISNMIQGWNWIRIECDWSTDIPKVFYSGYNQAGSGLEALNIHYASAELKTGWHRVLQTYNKSSQYLVLYVDGILRSSGYWNLGNNRYHSTKLQIGVTDGGGNAGGGIYRNLLFSNTEYSASQAAKDCLINL